MQAPLHQESMTRYFLEVAYKGSGFAGFQIQQNAKTIQGEIDKALTTLMRTPVVTTGSSRTDAGVHAYQNFLHLDIDIPLPENLLYKLNAILPRNIAVRALYPVPAGMHARFDALSRTYEYRIYTYKDPFLQDFGYYFPYVLNEATLHATALLILEYQDFTSFSKRNTQVKTFNCQIMESYWNKVGEQYHFHIKANRFLRGMVRGLVGTMLKTARNNMTIDDFKRLIDARNNRLTDFSAPPQGLFLKEVYYPTPFRTVE